MTRYAELQATSHFSFLRGASSPEDLFSQAALCGIEALAVCDRGSVAGLVRAHEAAKVTGVRAVVGSRLDLKDGTALLVYPTDRAAYARLCRLLTLGKGRAGKTGCELDWADLETWSEGLLAMLVPDEADATCSARLRRLSALFGDRAYIALTLRRRPRDPARLLALSNLAIANRIAPVVTNDILFATPAERILQDVVTCIREHCTIDDAGFRRERHADRYLKGAEEMGRLFHRHPEALARSVELVERCRFSLDELTYTYPEEILIPGLSAQAALEKLTWEAAALTYPAIRESLSRMEAQLNRIDGSTRDLSTRQAEQSVRLDELTGQTAAMNDRVTAQTATMNDRVAAMEAQLGVGQHAPGLVNNPAPGAAAIQPAAEMVEVSFFDTNRPVTSAVRDILKIRASERTEDQQKTADRAFKECFVKPIGGGQYVVPMGTDLTGMGDIVDGETTRMTKVQEPHAAEERIYYWVPPTAGDRAAAAAVPELRPEGRAGSRWDNDAMKSIAQLYVAEAGVDVGPCAHWLQVDVETGKVMTPAAGKSTRELTMIKIPQVRQPAANQNRRDGIGL